MIHLVKAILQQHDEGEAQRPEMETNIITEIKQLVNGNPTGISKQIFANMSDLVQHNVKQELSLVLERAPTTHSIQPYLYNMLYQYNWNPPLAESSGSVSALA